MKISRIFMTTLMIVGFVFMVSSNTMADNRFTIDKESIANIVKNSERGLSGFDTSGHTEIAWKVKLHNSSDKPIAFDVTVTFVNADKDKLGETTKTCRIGAGESKRVSNMTLLDSAMVDQIDTGYVSIAKAGDTTGVETLSLIASVDNDVKGEVADVSDRYVKIDYNVKLRNKSAKPVNSDLTIAFLDEDNVKIGESKTKGSFEAGESKTISDTIVLRTSDVSRISSGRVVIEK